jgi:SAM-dependent methyltransferase
MDIHSIGSLDAVDSDGVQLHLRGWFLSKDAGRLADARIEMGGEVLGPATLALGQPSPDVARAFPALAGGDACRFEVRAPLPRPGAAPRNACVSLTPVYERGAGRPLFGPLNLDLPLPPERLIEGVGGGFLLVAYAFLAYFVHHGRLRPQHAVLDIGCGCGRMAYALGPYLDPQRGRYRGFDIVDEQVQWAARHVSGAFPNLAFEKVDIYNEYYNPKGRIRSERFVFPYPDASFDFTFLTSVFTHMLKDGTIQYLREISRTLRGGGHCLATCFLLNDESEALIRQGRSSRQFPHRLEGCRVADLKKPEGAVAFPERDFLSWCREAGLEVVRVLGGHWCGRADYTDLQDIVVLRKAG